MGDVSTFVLIELDSQGRTAESVQQTVRRAIRVAGAELTAVPSVPSSPTDDRTTVGALCGTALTALLVVLELRPVLADRDPTARVAIWTDDPADATDAAPGGPLARGVELLCEARPGQVLASATSAVLIGPALPADVELVDLGTRVLAPGRRSERIYELAPTGARSSADIRGPAGRAGPTSTSNLSWAHRAVPGPVAGRDHLLARLEAAWRSTLRGERRAVVLRGESGIGKTALAAEMALRVHAAGAVVLYGRWDRELAVPYQAFREALGAYARNCPAEQLRDQLDGARAALRLLLPEADPWPRTSPAARAVGRGDPEGRRLELYGAVHAWLDLLATERPVLVVLDDLHWAERSSLLLLDSLQDSASRAPWMLLATARTRTGGTASAALTSPAVLEASDSCDHIELPGLDTAAIARLATQTLGCSLQPDSPAVDALAVDTAGNPLLVLQILRSIDDVTEVDVALEDMLHRLPTRLADVIRWRLSQLPSRSRALLADTAVVGSTIDVDLAATAVRLPPVVLDQALEPAVEEGLLTTEVPRTSYSFAHEVIRRALVDSVDAARRALLHRRTAAALEARASSGSGTDLPATSIADHYLLGADRATAAAAVRWARLGAAAACEATGYYEAVDLLARALEVHETFGDGPLLGCELRLELAEAHELAGQFTARDQRHVEAADLARELDRTDLFVRAALGYAGRLPASPFPDRVGTALVEEALRRLPPSDSRERALLLGRLAHVRHLDAPYEVRRSLSDEAVAMARRLGDDLTLAKVLVARTFALDGLPDAEENMATGHEIAEIARRLDDVDLRLQSLRMQAEALIDEGRYDEANARATEHVSLAARIGHQDALRLAAMWDVFWSVLRGDHAESEALVDGLVTRLQQAGHPQARLIGYAYTFVPRWMQGELERSRRMTEAIRALDQSTPSWAISLWLDASTGREEQARRELAEHDPTEVIGGLDRNFLWWPTVVSCAVATTIAWDRRWAEVLYDAIVPYSGRLGTAGYALFAGAIDHHLGTMALVLDRRADAIDHLRSGLASHRALDAPSFVALSAHWLARALATGTPSDDDREEAATLAAEAAAIQGRLGLAGLPDLGELDDPDGR